MGIREVFRSWEETVKVFFLHTMPLKGGLLFYADVGKTNARAYLFAFIFRNANRLVIVCFTWAHEDATPLWHNFLGREKGASKRRNLGSVCRERGGNARSSVLRAISLLNYAWNGDSRRSQKWRIGARNGSLSMPKSTSTVRAFYFRFEAGPIDFLGSFDRPWNTHVLSKTRRRQGMLSDFSQIFLTKTFYSRILVRWERFSTEDNMINGPNKNEYDYRG